MHYKPIKIIRKLLSLSLNTVAKEKKNFFFKQYFESFIYSLSKDILLLKKKKNVFQFVYIVFSHYMHKL